ncbi:transcriptional regulator, PadR family [Aneurinibacillus aneurinilyticus ATCC 12856]|jgi:PadR family transcriptional regulator PadR|uniref:Transcriptional regulator, PadR family n=2 Tax=Aneurinibacillus aneurinilyticus TaxID=1391 RepID=U1XZP2_ANEAE|nr:transcriptional regulator, PadR family [Aneurinibacillus aneurinilyticus ATCC 12856]
MMFDRELVKGSTSLLLLRLLSEKDMYGYELVKEMEKRSEDSLTFKEGTLYPALHKLQSKALIDSYIQRQEKGPDRKYYRITEEGQKVLHTKTKEWSRFVHVMSKIIGEKPL